MLGNPEHPLANGNPGGTDVRVPGHPTPQTSNRDHVTEADGALRSHPLRHSTRRLGMIWHRPQLRHSVSHLKSPGRSVGSDRKALLALPCLAARGRASLCHRVRLNDASGLACGRQLLLFWFNGSATRLWSGLPPVAPSSLRRDGSHACSGSDSPWTVSHRLQVEEKRPVGPRCSPRFREPVVDRFARPTLHHDAGPETCHRGAGWQKTAPNLDPSPTQQTFHRHPRTLFGLSAWPNSRWAASSSAVMARMPLKVVSDGLEVVGEGQQAHPAPCGLGALSLYVQCLGDETVGPRAAACSTPPGEHQLQSQRSPRSSAVRRLDDPIEPLHVDTPRHRFENQSFDNERSLGRARLVLEVGSARGPPAAGAAGPPVRLGGRAGGEIRNRNRQRRPMHGG